MTQLTHYIRPEHMTCNMLVTHGTGHITNAHFFPTRERWEVGTRASAITWGHPSGPAAAAAPASQLQVPAAAVAEADGRPEYGETTSTGRLGAHAGTTIPRKHR